MSLSLSLSDLVLVLVIPDFAWQVLEDSLHDGCPVVLGDKWVFNKWVIA